LRETGYARRLYKNYINGIGIQTATKIDFRVLTNYLTINTGFTDFRDATIQATKDLYGGSSNELTSVGEAWWSVNLGKPSCSTSNRNMEGRNYTESFEDGFADWVPGNTSTSWGRVTNKAQYGPSGALNGRYFLTSTNDQSPTVLTSPNFNPSAISYEKEFFFQYYIDGQLPPPEYTGNNRLYVETSIDNGNTWVVNKEFKTRGQWSTGKISLPPFRGEYLKIRFVNKPRLSRSFPGTISLDSIRISATTTITPPPPNSASWKRTKMNVPKNGNVKLYPNPVNNRLHKISR